MESQRNQTSRPPSGICTRSQSQIQLHRTRSGRVINSLRPASGPDRKRPRPSDSSDGDVLLSSLIKDLRVKRVFPQTYKPPENLVTDTEFCYPEREDNPKKSKPEAKEPENLGFGSDLGGGSGSDPDFTLTSSPEAKASGAELKLDSETKTVLKTRKRVFKAPGSFSYRRMLPFLKDITQDNSCMLELCELPNRGKGLEGKSSGSKLVSDNQESHTTFDSDTQLETASYVPSNGDHLITESPENVPKSPPIAVADRCLPKPPVDGQNENIDLGVSCEVQKPFCSSAKEDSQVNMDVVMVMSTDDNTPVENMGTAVQDDTFSSSKDQIVNDIYPQSSSGMDERYSCTDNEVVQHKGNLKQAQCEWIDNIDMGYPCDVQSPNHTNEQRVGTAEEDLSQICDFHEEFVQTTPPDAEILDKLQVEVKVIGRAEYVHQSTDQGFGKRSNGNIYRDASQVDLRHECSPKRKLVLNPCSRLKLFKSPGSVSYRRLLPFLMDMEKGASVSSRSESTVKDLEQRQPLTPSQLGPPMDKSNVLLFHAEAGTPTSQLKIAHGSSDIDGPNTTSPEHVTGSQIPSNVQKEVHGEHSASGKQSKLDTSPNIIGSLGQAAELSVPVLSPKKSESVPERDGVRTSGPELPVTTVLSLSTVEDCRSSETALNDGGKPLEANGSGQNSSEINATISSITPAVAVRKGILKRNPRGCRGLCTCLNCASFRLHAERAFEFSRNQMQDAEEVALHLMKELANLRKLLEESAAANDHVVTLNEVKSACRKASEAEDLARNRLGEMNYDLNIHCRITCLHEPRVRFANHSEEKVIPKAKCSRD